MSNATSFLSPDQLPPSIRPDEMQRELERVLQSETLRQAPVLQRFLNHVSSKVIQGLSEEIKEVTIAAEVMGRPPDYDPKIDTVVRVDAHRLREKLEEYYRTEGATDEILIEIPKGHYVPRFSRRPARLEQEIESSSLPSAKTASAILLEEASRQQAGEMPLPRPAGLFRKQAWIRTGLIVAGVVLVAAAALFLFRRASVALLSRGSTVQASETASRSEDPALSALWASFLADQNPPIVAYSNSVFLADQYSDLLRLRNEEIDGLGAPAGSDVARRLAANPRLLNGAGPVFFEDVYTGTGEVMAVFYLTRMFGRFHSSIEVERSRLVSIDDLRSHDAIFLGSTKEDALLAGLPLPGDFAFYWPEKPPRVWNGRIVNLHPQPGEPASFEVERDPKTGVLKADYALVNFLPGISPNRKIVILGGLTTLGTQGAAEFATSPAGVSEMLARLDLSAPGSLETPLPFFQAVLRVGIMKDEVLSIKCVAAHRIHPGSNGAGKS